MRRAALLAAASLAAILIQLTLLNRLPLPGGAAPDLVLVLVVAVALTGGPMDGMLTGFFAGLALDVAPPASHLVGQYALVFCVAGYAAGRLSNALSRASWLPLGAVALCAAGGEALYAAVGMLFGDPGVTWSAVRHVLPVSVGYDLLVCPFVLRATVAARAWTTHGWSAEGLGAGRGALAGSSGAATAGVAAAGAGRAVRDTGTGRSPRLRVATGRPGDGWIGGASQRAGRAAAQVLATRPTHLRLRGGQAGSAAGGGASKTLPARPVHLHFGHGGGSARSGPSSGQGAKVRSAPPVHLRFGGGARRRDGAVGGSVLGRLGSGPKMLRGRAPRGRALRRGMPGGSALRGGMPGPGALGSRAPGSKAPGSKGLGSKGLSSRALGSKARGSKARGSRALGSTALGSQARGGRRPRGSALRGGGPGGSAVSRGGGSFGNGLRSGSGKGAEPHFRRQSRRGAGTGGRARRGLAGGGWLRRGRRRARFGRRSTVWRIGSKRTGGRS